MELSNFTNNKVQNNGGAIYLKKADLFVKNTIIN